MRENIRHSFEQLLDKIICNEEEIVRYIENPETTDSDFLLTYFNQHAFNIFWDNEEYRNWLLTDFHVFYDGIGLFSVLSLYKRARKRLVATDTYNKIFNRIINNAKYKIALIGGKEELHAIISNHSEIKNIVFHKEGNFTDNFIKEIETELLLYGPNILMIAMGTPLQEEVALHVSKIYHNCLIICVGNFLEFYFGSIKRAPVIFQKLGIEWLFRLITEPRRLWKRYILGIPEFLYRIIKIKFGLK